MTTKRISAATAVAMLLSLSQLANAVPIKWDTNGHWYDFVRLEGVNWEQANAAATSSTHMGETGHLVTLTSQAENDFVFSLVDFKPFSTLKGSIWLGGVQTGGPEPAGGWTWVTGEAWSYTNWAPVEPNNGNFRGEEHLTFDDFTARNGTWNDWYRLNGASGYVIEYSIAPTAVPEPDTLLLIGSGLLGLILIRRRRLT